MKKEFHPVIALLILLTASCGERDDALPLREQIRQEQSVLLMTLCARNSETLKAEYLRADQLELRLRHVAGENREISEELSILVSLLNSEGNSRVPVAAVETLRKRLGESLERGRILQEKLDALDIAREQIGDAFRKNHAVRQEIESGTDEPDRLAGQLRLVPQIALPDVDFEKTEQMMENDRKLAERVRQAIGKEA